MIWDFQDALTRRLLLWSALSILAGAVLAIAGGPFWRGFGVQAVAWGVIDAAIAAFGQRASQKRRRLSPGGADAVQREGRNLRRLLWINAGLDVLYMAGGIWLARTLGQGDPFPAGNGWGIVAQGAFLFAFDLLHALAVPGSGAVLAAPGVFDGAEHLPFSLSSGSPSALLVHGFGGTPAEMRALAEALHAEGWSARAVLLPGFGSGIDTLPERRHEEWLAAVVGAAGELKAAGARPLVLVGYSLGAALSLAAAREARADGLILLAPFYWEEKWWTRPAEFFVRPFLPIGFRPLRKADLNDPRLRQGIAKFMPGIDLDDPAVKRAMRDFRMPMGLIDEVRALSRRALAAAPDIDTPALVIQGARDEVVRNTQTRRLVKRLNKRTLYVEVHGGHDLTGIENPAWPEVSQAVIDFSAGLRGRGRNGPDA